MRAFWKERLKGKGTPVLQTLGPQGETILSAANIWTCAHARRIELRDHGLERGGVLCSAIGGFQSAIDFVACAIGGFVYLPTGSDALAGFRRETEEQPSAAKGRLILVDEAGALEHCPSACLPDWLEMLGETPNSLLALLGDDGLRRKGLPRVFTGEAIEARLGELSRRIAWGADGTRLSYDFRHFSEDLIDDLLSGLSDRQTILLRQSEGLSARQIIDEALHVCADDVVLPAGLIEPVLCEASRLDLGARSAVSQIRFYSRAGCMAGREPILQEHLSKDRSTQG